MIMKKKYISPSTLSIDIQMVHMLCASAFDNTLETQELIFTNETVDEFTSRRSVWDEFDF